MRSETPTVKKCFRKSIKRMSYDVSEAHRHQIQLDIMNLPIHDVVSEAIKFIRKTKCSDDFYSAMQLATLLEDSKITARLSSVSFSDGMGGKTHTHFCVWYVCDGEEYIADPAYSIEENTEYAFCNIPLQEYLQTYLRENKNLNIFPPLEWKTNRLPLKTFLLIPDISY